MESQYKDEKDIIVLCEENNNYLEGIRRCNVLLSKVKKDKNTGENYKKEFYFCYYMLAKLYKNYYGLSKINITLEYAQKAFKYNYNQMEYIRSIWLLAECYLMINNIDKAIKIYKRCSQYYYSHKLNDYYLMVLFNISKLSNRTNLMLLIINKYKKQYKNDTKTVNDMLVELFDTYILNNTISNRRKAISLLHSIEDKSLVKMLRQKLLVA